MGLASDVMPLKFLRALSKRGLPVNVTEPEELSAVRLLYRAGCLTVRFDTTDAGEPCAIVERLTAIGRTVMKGSENGNSSANNQ